ncbi:hypothetical protein [Flavobacterium sp.]|uniref:hypothetical protein n=1 Tax=Flavobacterium sp. TaxID=239 RepID=UPI00375192EB
MEDKNSIDRKRESGGMAEIGTKEDGAILEMPKIGDRLIVIKEKSIYEFMMADDIDPERTNINLPNNIHKLVIGQGADSELVSKTFLTAKTLFKSEFFDKSIDTDRALTLSLEILQEIVILEKEINDYIEKEEKVSEEYEGKRNKSVSYSIPAIGDIETRCKTIFQKADHIEQILIEIIAVFYPNEGLKKQSHFPNLYDILIKKYGEADPFVVFVKSASFFMKTIRNMRNALDHRLDNVKLFDFELQKDSSVLSPTFQLNHKESKLKRQSLSGFLKIMIPNLTFVFENTVAYMSNKTFKPNITAQGVKEIPEEIRRYKHVKYSFWSPLGEGGYYNQ